MIKISPALLAIGTAAFHSMAAPAAHASAPSIEEFAARPSIEGASISPDGHHLAIIKTDGARAGAVVMDLGTGTVDHPGMVLEHLRTVMGEPDRFRMTWCRWATDARLLCGFLGMTRDRGVVYPVTRLAAVDADGRNMKVLIQNSESAQGQFQDRIINWNPGTADTVLIEADEGLSDRELAVGTHVYGNVGTHALPAVFELNVVSGHLNIRQHARDPIRHWITDKRGAVRLGWGFSGTTISYFARLDGDHEWRRLTKFEVFSREKHFDPVAISGEESNKAYAYASHEGRKALWLIDLTDKEEPTLVFSHPAVDVGGALLARDGRLLGIHYDPGYPMTYFTDEKTTLLNQSFQKLRPAQHAVISGSTRDESIYLVRYYSDLEPSSFIVVDIEHHASISLGSPYRDRDLSALSAMRSVSYPARDGTSIPAYLSAPPGTPPANLPLVVMPHGGPIARDTWSYFFLREFLLTSGYAVLQMNFRGSSGYGDDWFFSAHQDWGGLTYDDVVDGARWAIRQGIADPRRVCIVGWSFGGYLALLGAQRNADVFRCAVDIAGVSDLGMLIDEGHEWLSSESIKRQIGTDKEKLKRDSPRLHAADFGMPLLMIHGTMDAQVPFEQGEDMDRALTRAGKPHRFVVVPDGDHPLSAAKDRVILLREIQQFLGAQLNPAGTP